MKATTVKRDFFIPKEVSKITQALKKSEFEAYLVGGCVRDLFLNKTPKDWDVTTNATPEQIISLFEKTFYENDYGTVGVVDENTVNKSVKVVEVTPYRIEAGYSDARRPDSVIFSQRIDEDLKRRDFTINAVAYDAEQKKTVDLFGGIDDIKKKIIRAVGIPKERFMEDALRTLRAVRFFAELGFEIEENTKKAITETADQLSKISKERIRDEFTRIVASDRAVEAIVLTHELGMLKYIIPDLEKGIGIKQNKAHSFDVWTHLLKTLSHSVKKKMSLEVRLSALFHDIGKPDTRVWSEEKKDWTFHGHDVVGARITSRIMKDLRFPKEFSEKVVKLVRWHMFFSDTDQITHSAVRRLVANVGQDDVWSLMNVRAADRIGTGRPKESPYRLRKYHSMIEEVMRDPVSVSMLKINGQKIIDITGEKPGPRIGFILHSLLEEVLENPKFNTEEHLENKAKELAKMGENELKKIGELGKEKKQQEEEKIVKEIRKKHWVE